MPDLHVVDRAKQPETERSRRGFPENVKAIGSIGVLLLFVFLATGSIGKATDAMDREFARDQLGLVCVNPDQVTPGVEPVDLDQAYNEISRQFVDAVRESAMDLWKSDSEKLDEILQKIGNLERRLDTLESGRRTG